MADVKITDLPVYASVTSPATDVIEIVDFTNNLSKQISVSNLLTTGGGGVQIQVNGTTVPPSNGAINIVDSSEPANAVQVENAQTNQISFSVDVNTPFWATSLSLISDNVPKVGLSVAAGGTPYSLVIPNTQGLSGQYLANNGNGILSWTTPVPSGVVSFGLPSAPRTGAITIAAGPNITITESPDGTYTIRAAGGGGGLFTASSIWTGGTSTKNAFTSPGVANNQGITISLEASSGTGDVTNVTVSLNGVALSNTYTSTGTFPDYTIAVPVADLVGNVAETAASVQVSLIGTFDASNINISNAGTLTNIQPTPFSATLSATYAVASLPYFTTTATINYSYAISGAATSLNGFVTPTGGSAQSATSNSGSFPNQPINGAVISGTATGVGLAGAGTSTVNLSGSVPAVSVYIPAFYAQTANNVPPTFTTSSSRTSSAAQGSTITYPIATASTQYDWVCTQRPLANLILVTPFGNAPLIPDVTGPTQTISGQTFSVYGFTNLSTSVAPQLRIT